MKKKIVMAFGVFDLLHPGHINFLQQAKRYGDYLIVSVARDKNVKKIKNKLPFRNEKQRVDLVKTLKIADKIVLGAVGNPWPHIRKEKPDVIALGYDQAVYVNQESPMQTSSDTGQAGIGNQEKLLEQELQKRGLKTKVIRLKPFKPQKYKTTIINKSLRGA